MAEKISYELRDRAKELYILEGLTLDQVAKATGISVQSLNRWSAKEGWRSERKEYRDALGEIKRNTILLRKNLIDKALESLDLQDVHAAARFETAVRKAHQAEPEHMSAGDLPTREIKTPQDAVNALQDAVEQKLNIMLAQPGALNLAGVKDLKMTMELVDQIKAKYVDKMEADGKKKNIDPETLRIIREEVYGII